MEDLVEYVIEENYIHVRGLERWEKAHFSDAIQNIDKEIDSLMKKMCELNEKKEKILKKRKIIKTIKIRKKRKTIKIIKRSDGGSTFSKIAKKKTKKNKTV